MQTSANAAKRGISSIGKTFQILKCFSYNRTELTAAQIAKQVGLPISTLYRYLQTMEGEGFLEHNAAANTYSLGLYSVELAGIALTRFDVRRIGQQDLNDLSIRLNLNTNMGILRDGDVFHLAFSVRTPMQPWYDIIGRRSAAHLTAMGKMLLAYQPFEQVRGDIEKRGWRARTKYSVHDLDELHRQLIEARERQYAVDLREYTDTCCLACPIRQKDGEVVAAISATCAYDRFSIEIENIRREVFAAAANISYKLGYLGQGYMLFQPKSAARGAVDSDYLPIPG